jgi:hypothetical protein
MNRFYAGVKGLETLGLIPAAASAIHLPRAVMVEVNSSLGRRASGS